MQSEQKIEDGHDPYLIIEEMKTKILSLEQQNTNLLKVLNQFRSAMCGKMIEADFYHLIQDMVKENATLKEQWRDLVMVMQMVDPEINDKFKEILNKDRNGQMIDYIDEYEAQQKYEVKQERAKQ